MTSPCEVLAHLADAERRRIVSLEAGPEVDALVAEQVFGWRLGPDGYWQLPDGSLASPWKLPAYSQDAAAAMLVCERMRERGYVVNIRLGPDDRDALIQFDHDTLLAETFPLAVARCALLALVGAGR